MSEPIRRSYSSVVKSGPRQVTPTPSGATSMTEQPPSDSLQNINPTVPIGEAYLPQNIQEDLEALKGIGFIIDYPKGHIGEGVFGKVFKGVYGPQAKDLTDKEGQPLRNVDAGLPFAAKMVDFSTMDLETTSPEHIHMTRDSYQTEKYIMTWANHPNITPIRMAINMGEPGIYKRKGSEVWYRQHQRIYLILDFAELGSLSRFWLKNRESITSTDRIKLTQDLFWGMKYLHDNGVAHGDVKKENVLVFKEETGFVAKWADFGVGYVSQKGEYTPSPKLDDKTLHKRKVRDIQRLFLILNFMWGPFKEEDETIKQLCAQFVKMKNELKGGLDGNLDQLLINYGSILNWNRSH